MDTKALDESIQTLEAHKDAWASCPLQQKRNHLSSIIERHAAVAEGCLVRHEQERAYHLPEAAAHGSSARSRKAAWHHVRGHGGLKNALLARASRWSIRRM